MVAAKRVADRKTTKLAFCIFSIIKKDPFFNHLIIKYLVIFNSIFIGTMRIGNLSSMEVLIGMV